MRRFTRLLALLLLVTTYSQAETVDARQYQSFWLWAGVKPQPLLRQAQSLYLLQGEITRQQGQVVFLRQGYPPGRIPVAELWLVYRVSTLDWTPQIQQRILNHYRHWRKLGNSVAGIQIDFDAASHRLEYYGDFLRELRSSLPASIRLSVTGLLDWAKTGDHQQLNRLHDVIDEIIIQSYQGRHTVTRYAEYLPALSRLTLPFKIGLVQDGQWDKTWENKLAALPNYHGAVVFLLNPAD